MKQIYTYLSLFLLASTIQMANAQSKGSVSDVSFIEGSWKATMPDGQSIEGVWLPQSGENMVGFMRMMRGGKIDLYEILAYEPTENGLVSMVKHFKPGLIGQEEKDKKTVIYLSKPARVKLSSKKRVEASAYFMKNALQLNL